MQGRRGNCKRAILRLISRHLGLAEVVAAVLLSSELPCIIESRSV